MKARACLYFCIAVQLPKGGGGGGGGLSKPMSPPPKSYTARVHCYKSESVYRAYKSYWKYLGNLECSLGH